MMPASTETPLEPSEAELDLWGAPKYHPALAVALVAAWGELADVPERQKAKGRAFDYTYADLADVHAVSRPVLARHGLAVVQRVEVDGRVVVTTEVVHVSGHAAEFGPIILPAGGDAQAVGSAITYARRYLLCAALGIAPKGDDDDGQGATPPPDSNSPDARRDRGLEPIRPAPQAGELDEVKGELARWRQRLEPLEDHPVAVMAKAEFVRAGLTQGAPITKAKGKAVLAALARLEAKVADAEHEMLVDQPLEMESDGDT